jgi:hypothetical protein
MIVKPSLTGRLKQMWVISEDVVIVRTPTNLIGRSRVIGW